MVTSKQAISTNALQHCFLFNVALSPQRPDGEGEPRTSTSSLQSSMVLFFRGTYFTSTETVRTVRDGELRTATSTFTQLLNSFFSVALRSQRPYGISGTKRPSTSTFTQLLTSVLQCCFTSTETLRTIRDGEPRTSTSTFTQLLNSFFSVALRPHYGMGTQDVCFVFHTAPELLHNNTYVLVPIYIP